MKLFDRKWQIGAAVARQATASPLSEIPFGFATRVAAEWQARACRISSDIIWERLSLRALVCASVLLLFSVGWSFMLAGESQVLKPDLEHTVADLFWML